MSENRNLVEACRFTPGCYGNCPACSAADQCPRWLDTGLGRALVRADDPCREVRGVSED